MLLRLKTKKLNIDGSEDEPDRLQEPPNFWDAQTWRCQEAMESSLHMMRDGHEAVSGVWVMQCGSGAIKPRVHRAYRELGMAGGA